MSHRSGSMRAPPFPGNLLWLNTDHSLTLEELKGKFVLLDFWTYCCINCMHVIPDLKSLEQKYPELVVIGVHSAKFENERDVDNIVQAILRYDLEHPVVVDSGFSIWRSYGISSWPSFILIAPDGEVLGRAAGEGIFERVDCVMGSLIEEYDRRGLLDRERMRFRLIKDSGIAPRGPLSFPGKVSSDPVEKRLFIADSGHNRILITDAAGEIIQIIGSGNPGKADGPFDKASFLSPQGLVRGGQYLYIADTGNHLIRRADLVSKSVETVAGTGRHGFMESAGPGLEVSLNSPWDLTVAGGWIYIAMAGSHQIWRMDKGHRIEPVAGSGREGIVDGPLGKAELAQPSGITTDGQVVYFADSEVSALRVLDPEKPEVRTLIGTGLFDFGDIDGPFKAARLQHPLGVLYHEGSVYLADTYNHRIKRADLASGTVESIAGTGRAGRRDGRGTEAELSEPGGLAVMDGKIYIADTNNHMIRVYDIESGMLSTLEVREMEAGVAGCEVCGIGGAGSGVFGR